MRALRQAQGAGVYEVGFSLSGFCILINQLIELKALKAFAV
jgi:hypothetical protein